MTKRPAAVYRFYDAADTLLYVGYSGRPWLRLPAHSYTAPGEIRRSGGK
jgi:hypothetical protein